MASGWDAGGTVIRNNGRNTGDDVWAVDAAAAQPIDAAGHDAHDQGLADSIADCLHIGGYNAMTADLDMNTNDILSAANIQASGDIVFTERADHASTPGAGKGYLWVKSNTPSMLHFTDDAGTDHNLITPTYSTLTVDNITINGAAITSDTGAISFGNENLTTSGTISTSGVLNETDDLDGLTISGSTTVDTGANIRLYGANGIIANDITFRVGTSTKLQYDYSEAQWESGDPWIITNWITTSSGVALIGTNALTLTSGADQNSGTRMALNSASHAIAPYDLKVTSPLGTVLLYDHSAAEWNFSSLAITTTGTVTAGTLKTGTHSAIGAETVTGYITIKDASGTNRKIAVVS